MLEDRLIGIGLAALESIINFRRPIQDTFVAADAIPHD